MGAAEVAGEGAGEQAHLELVHGTGRRRFGLTHDHTAGWALVSDGRCDSLRAAADAMAMRVAYDVVIALAIKTSRSVSTAT